MGMPGGGNMYGMKLGMGRAGGIYLGMASLAC